MSKHWVTGSILLLLLCAVGIWQLGRPDAPPERPGDPLTLFCAAGLKPAMDEILTTYQSTYKVTVDIQYGGSGTLLSSIQIVPRGDLYLPADSSYLEEAIQKDLVRESIPAAHLSLVLAVPEGNPAGITSLDDLLRDGVRLAVAHPDQAAVGRRTRQVLQKRGLWASVEQRVKVMKPTVSDVATDLKLKAVDAAFIWSATAHQFSGVEVVPVPDLDPDPMVMAVGVLSASKQPTRALHLARYLTARDRGLPVLARHGFTPLEGDTWADHPRLIFFAGSVNRQAITPVIQAFEAREGVQINTVFNGCGILTSQMRVIHEQEQDLGFPDMYIACDVYYLDNVRDWFQDAVNVSSTDMVIVVPKGNPQGLQTLDDLTQPGLRVAIGQPEQCTIGALTRRMLQALNLYEPVLENVVTQTPSSAMLVPSVVTGAADATLAYRTDTLSVTNQVDTVLIPSDLAQAVQPFSIARRCPHKRMARRFRDLLGTASDSYTAYGFQWQFGATNLVETAVPQGAEH